MKHYTYEEWLKYVSDRLSAREREQMEGHLYTCDQCLDLYLQVLDANETSFPILDNDSSFTDLVMAEVSKQKVSEHVVQQASHSQSNSEQQVKQKEKPFYQQALFHYLLAAAATLLLTFSGAFKSLASFAAAFEGQSAHEKKATVTEGVINKTFAWMDSLETKEADQK